MDILNKMVLEHWSNNGFESKWLRHFNRKGKKYHFSDCNYSLNCGDEKYTYSIMKKCAEKVLIKNGEITRSIGHLSNTDGVMTYTVIDDIQSLICKHSFSELFETNLNEILPNDSYKLEKIKSNIEFRIKHNITIEPSIYTYSEDLHEENKKSNPFLDYLRTFFNREKIFYLLDYCDERDTNMSIIERSMIRMHVNHFGNFAKVIDFNTNHNNRTIGFWLFENCLVYTDQSGKSNW